MENGNLNQTTSLKAAYLSNALSSTQNRVHHKIVLMTCFLSEFE